jgi:hypothetical protein
VVIWFAARHGVGATLPPNSQTVHFWLAGSTRLSAMVIPLAAGTVHVLLRHACLACDPSRHHPLVNTGIVSVNAE